MKNILIFLGVLLITSSLAIQKSDAQNPLIRDQFTADPTGRVFKNKLYVFPSHDIFAVEGKGRPGWFCMEDYHVFSSENLSDWTDHGVIVSQYNVDWVDSTSYSMWAPDCIERNGKYYFYFPANTNIVGPNGRKGFGIGVAVADQPEGPYTPQKEPIKGIFGIDPNILIDNDGQAYIYWSLGNIYVAKLKENMLELDSDPMIIENLPTKGLKEGPFVFERNGIYYLTFPHVENKIERLEYAVGKSPIGPFEMTGVIMNESPMNCWTNHHSVLQYNDQWYLFYHQNALSPDFDKNRAICLDSLFFNADGTIQTVEPTLRGVGLSSASNEIQIDRYSEISETGTNIAFNDTTNTFNGWNTIFNEKGAWIKYNAVDFGKKKMKNIRIKARSNTESIIQIKLNNIDGPVIGEIKLSNNSEWKTTEQKLSKYPKGIQNIVLETKDVNQTEIDWIQFF